MITRQHFIDILSVAELRTAFLVHEGMNRNVIAELTKRKVATVEYNLSRIYRKLKINVDTLHPKAPTKMARLRTLMEEIGL